MMRHTWWAVFAAVAFLGCDTSPPVAPAPGGPNTSSTSPDPASKVEGKMGPAVTLTDAEVANLKKLPEADAKLALEQKICPVSDEHLGSGDMEPVKVTVEGQTVMLCCEGCKETIEKEPAKFLAKIGKGK